MDCEATIRFSSGVGANDHRVRSGERGVQIERASDHTDRADPVSTTAAIARENPDDAFALQIPSNSRVEPAWAAVSVATCCGVLPPRPLSGSPDAQMSPPKIHARGPLAIANASKRSSWRMCFFATGNRFLEFEARTPLLRRNSGIAINLL
jgi:hypothetical protein